MRYGLTFIITVLIVFVTVLLSAPQAPVAFAQPAEQFHIDSPLPNSVQSGTVAPPNGWKCPRNGAITAQIDGGTELSLTTDLSRGDTAVVCANSGDNGFSLVPWNWNTVGSGQHTIEFFDAGVKFAEADFNVETFGTEFLLDAAGCADINNFPDPGAGVTLCWDQAIQNFRITQVFVIDTQPPVDADQ